MSKQWERNSEGRFVTLCFDRDGPNVRRTDTPLFGTASGYGPKQPTGWQVRINGLWRRVYCAIYSNAGTCYVRHAGHEFIVDL